MKTITRDQIKQHLDKGVSMILIEALPLQYFEEGHLPGAFQLLPDQVKDKASQLAPSKDQLIVTYCANTACQNSKTAAEAFIGLGYNNVAEYVEGKQDWIQAGLPVEKGTSCCAAMQEKKSTKSGGCCG